MGDSDAQGHSIGMQDPGEYGEMPLRNINKIY